MVQRCTRNFERSIQKLSPPFFVVVVRWREKEEDVAILKDGSENPLKDSYSP
jgi:hypothetical protein